LEAIDIFTYCIARARTSLSSANHSLNATRMAQSQSGRSGPNNGDSSRIVP
jgi:hypothetical protein